jgi:ribose transport system substrate-binding protein
MLSRPFRLLVVAAVVGVCAFALAACGGGSDSSSSSETSSGSETSTSSGGGEESEGTGGADVAAAEKALVPYLKHPSPFPVDEPLEKPLSPDTHFIYMQCGSPICQLQWGLFEAAGKALGVKMTRIKAGSQASEVTNAFDTAVAEDPDAVFVPAIEPSLFRPQLEQLQENGVIVATSGVVDPDEYGIEVHDFARKSVEVTGKMLAAKAVTEKGDEANIVYYEVPELAFIKTQKEAFEAEMETLCPECSVRYVDVPLATVGNSAPNRIVSDLQQNPDTNIAVYSTGEMSIGVPSALKTAGISDVIQFGFGATPANLEYIKNGEETGGLGIDLPVDDWALVDMVARTLIGQELSKQEQTEEPPVPDFQFLGGEDITFDPTNGWTGYPEYEEMFSKLWAGK